MKTLFISLVCATTTSAPPNYVDFAPTGMAATEKPAKVKVVKAKKPKHFKSSVLSKMHAPHIHFDARRFAQGVAAGNAVNQSINGYDPYQVHGYSVNGSSVTVQRLY